VRKYLLLLIGCSSASQICAQNNGTSIEVHEVLQLGTAKEYIVSGAESFAGGRLTCLSNSCLSALPVTWLSFEGKRINEELVELTWKTVYEQNNTGFEIERSLGNSTHFEKLAFVPAQENPAAVHTYQWKDPNNYEGWSYYRLKQIDLDAKASYSKLVQVKGYMKMELQIFPNPARGQLSFSIYLTSATKGVVSICDLGGRVLFRQPLSFEKGNNRKQLPVHQLPAAMYFFLLQLENKTTRIEKFLKE